MKMKNTLLAVLIFASLFATVAAASSSLEVGDYDVEYSYSGAEADKRFNLEVSITNLDNKAKENVTFEMDLNDPFDDVNSDEWNIGTLNADETVTYTFRIEVDEDTETGTEKIEFKLEDSEDDYDDEMKIKVTTNGADFEIIDTTASPDNINAGLDDVKFTITLENSGIEVEKVKAQLILPEGFTKTNSFSDKETIGTVSEGETFDISFNFNVLETVLSESYYATLKLTFEEDGEEEETELEVEIPIVPTPQFEIVSVNTEGDIIAGKKGTMMIKILNYGEEVGTQTSVKVFEKSEHPFEFVEKTSEIGRLDVNEEGVAIFEFDVDSSAKATKYIIDIQIRTVNNGDVLTFDKSVSIDVKEPEGVGMIVYIFGGLVLIGASSAGFFIKRKRK